MNKTPQKVESPNRIQKSEDRQQPSRVLTPNHPSVALEIGNEERTSTILEKFRRPQGSMDLGIGGVKGDPVTEHQEPL